MDLLGGCVVGQVVSGFGERYFLFCDAFTVMFVQRRALVAGEAMQYWVLTSQSGWGRSVHSAFHDGLIGFASRVTAHGSPPHSRPLPLTPLLHTAAPPIIAQTGSVLKGSALAITVIAKASGNRGCSFFSNHEF